jgi:hypothetical protein
MYISNEFWVFERRFTMKEIRTEIEIGASAERIWQTLTDFAAFPEWNPFIHRASGEIKTGARLEVFARWLDKNIRRGFEEMNHALKARVEKQKY